MENTLYLLIGAVVLFVVYRAIKSFIIKIKIGRMDISEAQIVDVRSTGEYMQGHAENTINIPLERLANSLKKLKKDKPVVVCCASGARSASARQTLRSNGFTDVLNAGSWRNI